MRLNGTPRGTGLLILAFLLGCLLGCASLPQPAQPVASKPASATGAGAPRLLILAVQQEPPGFNTQLVQGTSGIGGVDQVLPIAQNYLMIQSQVNSYVPQLASEALSVDRGTWRINADGSMDTIWKLRPNVKWQDGTPFTSADLAFSLEVYEDSAVPDSYRDVVSRMTSASTPDPLTFVIHWGSVYVQADRAPALTPMPRHLLEQLYETDKANFVNSPVFTTGFVGLGPYKLTNWESGTSMGFTRFDDYYLGPPPLDGVIVRFLPDSNAGLSNILAGSVDVLLSVGDLDAAMDVKRQWEGTGNQVLSSVSGNLTLLEIQFRPDYAKLQHGLIDRNTRQALYQAIDRATLAEVTTAGLAPVADSWIAPSDPLRPQLESSIPQFPYDPRHAREILASGGWAPGPDGVLEHQQSGERLELMLYGGPAQFKDLNVIDDEWKSVGVDVDLYVVPPELDRDRQTRSTLPGAGSVQAPGEQFYTDRMHSKGITSPTNGWSGLNRGGYSNPNVDLLLDQLVATIDQSARLPLHQALLQEQMGDVALMPLNWPVRLVLVLNGVQGVTGGSTWNINEWDKKA